MELPGTVRSPMSTVARVGCPPLARSTWVGACNAAVVQPTQVSSHARPGARRTGLHNLGSEPPLGPGQAGNDSAPKRPHAMKAAIAR